MRERQRVRKEGGVCVSVCARASERLCASEGERERLREKQGVCGSEGEKERGRERRVRTRGKHVVSDVCFIRHMPVAVRECECVCVRASERLCVCVCVRERESVVLG